MECTSPPIPDRCSRRRRFGIVACCGAALVWAGCNDNDFGPQKRRPNLPPETVLASGPPDSTLGTVYKVHFFWSGGDPDGTIDHFDYIVVDHPAAADSIQTGDPEALNRVVVRIPTPDDPRWTGTSAKDTTLVTIADQLRRDPAPPAGASENAIDFHNRMVRLQSYERWHTFFVRAVDNEGSVDPSPSYRSFNSQTLAPEVFLTEPVRFSDDE